MVDYAADEEKNSNKLQLFLAILEVGPRRDKKAHWKIKLFPPFFVSVRVFGKGRVGYISFEPSLLLLLDQLL